MVDWQVTAYTFRCDYVADEVTILVYPDWSVKCSGNIKYTGSRDASVELVKRSLNLKKVLECKGLDCSFITEYKLKLQHEEDLKASRRERR